MTFEEVEQSLPNGFHDAALRGISADFVNLSIKLEMELHASVEGDANPERYLRGVLSVTRPYLFFLDPPDSRYGFIPRGMPVNASGFALKAGKDPKIDALLQRIPADATAFVFFLDDWNTYLYVAGATVQFSWDYR